MEDFTTMPLNRFIDLAASDAPVPGGGGIAALAGALGTAMAAMAANFTVGRKKYAEHEEAMRSILDALSPVIDQLRDGVNRDAEAFSGIAAAYALPRDSDEQKTARKDAIDRALTASMRAPLVMMELCRTAAEQLPHLAETANPNLLSDVEVAAVMLEAAAKASQINVLVNSRSLHNDEARETERRANAMVEKIGTLAATARSKAAARRSIP